MTPGLGHECRGKLLQASKQFRSSSLPILRVPLTSLIVFKCISHQFLNCLVLRVEDVLCLRSVELQNATFFMYENNKSEEFRF